MSNLTACQQDALTELLNIGIGQAAAALSQVVDEEVQLAVPYVDVLTLHEAIQSIEAQASVRIAAVKQQFTGSFWGDALLLFPEAKSLELVRALLKELMSLPRHAINGCVVFMVDGNAIEALKANIDRFVGQLSGGE